MTDDQKVAVNVDFSSTLMLESMVVTDNCWGTLGASSKGMSIKHSNLEKAIVWNF